MRSKRVICVAKKFGLKRYAFRPRLVIMVKEPRAGKTKTRLAKIIGAARATGVYRAMMASLVARLGRDTRWQTVLAVSPDEALGQAVFGRGTGRIGHSRIGQGQIGQAQIGQGRGDLGQRLQRLADRIPAGPIVIVGTDIPAITPSAIASAFRALGRHDAVFGPSSDGGYWLVGLKRRPRVAIAFANVRWSSPHALKDTQANFRGLSVAKIAVLDDVDDGAAFAAMKHLIGRRVLPPHGDPT